MENERENKELNKMGEMKNIPRANRMVTDEEVEKVLRSAKEKMAEKKPEVKKEEEKKPEEKKPEVKVEEKKPEKKKPEVKVEEKKPEVKKVEEKKYEMKTVAKEEKKPEKKPFVVPDVLKEEKPVEDSKKTELPKDIEIEEPVIIDNSMNTSKHTDKPSVGRVVGNVLETIWTVVKIAVVLLIITAVSGVILSRNMMIRGENGSRKSLEGMQVAGMVSVNKSHEEGKVDKWLDNVTREKLTLETDDSSILVARKVVTNSKSNKWVVILHGYNGSMEDVYDIAMHYADEGYNILTPDLRANGESEGSFLGMGWTDRLDVINWVDVILKDNPSAEVVIHGIDTGADAALMLSGEPIKNSIKAIVAEGAYPNAWDVVKKEYKARYKKWPVFPFLNMLNPVMKVWAGYSLKDANAVKQVKNTSVPILLIRGGNDTYVTKNMTDELDKAIASAHEIYTIEAGTHEDCRYADPDNYYSKTFEFANKYVK